MIFSAVRANLLFDLLGGPKELTKRLNALGDSVTLSVRREPYLNEFLPGKPDDTTTPKQAARSLYALCEELKAADNEKLTLFLDWMSGNDTGKTLIRAGAPSEWQVADKSGSGSHGTRNDIAVLHRPNRQPIYAAVFTRRLTQSNRDYFMESLIAFSPSVLPAHGKTN